MKKAKQKTLLIFLIFLGFYPLYAQVPGVRWSKTVISYPDQGEIIYDAQPTNDKGFVMVGQDSIFSFQIGDLINKSVFGRPWIVKVDSAGNRLWQNSLPIMYDESAFYSVAVESDGGYIAVGGSGDFPVSQVVIVKYSSSGALLWQKKYGGTQDDRAYSIFKTKTNGFIIAGRTTSINGDVVGNNGVEGTSDVWLLRIDANGNLIWKKCFGGSQNEIAYAVTQTEDYSFIIAGSASSTNGNLTGNNGSTDGWVFKIDSSGNLIWQKNLGGSGVDAFQKLAVSYDNSVYLAGSCDSTVIGITGINTKRQNAWVAKTDATGNQQWSIAYGGSSFDIAYDIDMQLDGNLLVTGFTKSNDGDVVGNTGFDDMWLLNINKIGNLIWQRPIGTNGSEFGFAGIPLSENDFVVIGTKGWGQGISDGYIAKLGNSNTIKGTLFLDVNINGIKDAGEVNFNNATVKSQKGSSVLTGQPQNGAFKFDIDTGSYTTTVQLFNPYYTVVPASKNTNFTTYFNVDSFGFAIQPIANKQDLIVHLIPASPARPGFKAQYVLNYKNVGTTTIANGTVKLIKDSRAALSLAFPIASSVVADTITWNYTNLKPLDSVAIGIEFQLAPPPTLNINDTLKYTAVVLPVAGDLTPADDTSRLRQRVQGSYDPNDKQESFAGKIPLKNVQDGSYINYVIRFQNTGNDTAFFVRLLDTLDSKLDWNSFQMIGSSHAYNLTIKNGYKLNWFFDNIKLPDSTTNLARSIGFVSFRIKPKNNLQANDVISNKASIYFDYNLPIVTNTTNTLVFVETTTAVRDIQNNDMKLLVAPNPNPGQSILQISGKLIGKFEMKVIDNSGKIIMQQSITRSSVFETLQIPMDLQKLSSGVYYIQLQQKEKLWWQKVVVQ